MLHTCTINENKEVNIKLGNLKDGNAVAHSVNSNICYVVINLSVHSKSYTLTFFLLK